MLSAAWLAGQRGGGLRRCRRALWCWRSFALLALPRGILRPRTAISRGARVPPRLAAAPLLELLHAPADGGALRRDHLMPGEVWRQQVASGDNTEQKAALEAAQLLKKQAAALRAEPWCVAARAVSLLACCNRGTA